MHDGQGAARPSRLSVPGGSEASARALLGALLAAIALCAWLAPGALVSSVDARSYMEMIAGIADHGLPTFDNGPAAEHPELRARWNIVVDGELWGTYPPVYPYLMAPFYRLGGLRLAGQASFAVLGLLALAAFFLGRAIRGNPLTGALAAWISVAGNGLAAKGLVIGSVPLAAALITSAAFFGLRALRTGGRAGAAFSAAAGLTGGLAMGTHLLAVPMLGGLAAVLLFRAPLSRWAPFLGGVAIPVMALAAFNAERFGSLDPFSYGPCTWRVCQGVRGFQTKANLLIHAGPLAIWLAAMASAAWLARRRLTVLLPILGLGMLVPLAIPALGERMLTYALATFGLLVDLAVLPFDPPYKAALDGVGLFREQYVVKSLLQATPVLALAPLARLRSRREALLLALPIAALVASVLPRIEMSPTHLIGHSVLHVRYLAPGLPLAAILAAQALSDLPWRPRHAALGALAAAALGAWLWVGDGDTSFLRSFAVVLGSLIAGGLAAALVGLARRRPDAELTGAALWATAIALAWGFAAAVAIDFKHAAATGSRNRERLTTMEPLLPERVGLVGWPGQLDPCLSLVEKRDVQYADVSELGAWLPAERIVRKWLADGRRVFALTGRSTCPDGSSPWPGLWLERLPGADGAAEIHPATMGASSSSCELPVPAGSRASSDEMMTEGEMD